MINIKKVFLLVINLLALVGIGLSLSLQQSQQADRILNNNGLSPKYNVYKVSNNKTIKELITDLNKYPNNQIQVHLKSKYDTDRVLIWANYTPSSLPLEKSSDRYFSKSDFTNQVPLAVVGEAAKNNVITYQNHPYLKLDNQYISVIGQFKNSAKAKGYYLITGVNLPTANEKLKNYIISVDGLSNKQATTLAKQLKASHKVVDYATTYNRQHGINPTKKFIFTLLCVVVILCSSWIWGMIDSNQNRRLLVKRDIIQFLVKNNIFRFVMENLVLIGFTYLAIQALCFFLNKQSLLGLYFIIYLLECATYGLSLLFNQRKDKNHAKNTDRV
ncbi:hypothetical protein [Lactobacillus sp. PV012]|uniref:hypothetical protein n=1 Tax=Lactobacillus sp. PV012 TaxID=2594494 RepID=UPI00223FE5AB|nr:hypothetical protein [Lactobacillus sp. PV012]QNQ82313.1 hypothetical protein FP433_04320 [Lactobacillus sp. PV012]